MSGHWGWDGRSPRSPKFYLGNAFSLNMLQGRHDVHYTIDAHLIYPEFVPKDATSVVGHADVARLMATDLGRPVTVNRTTLTMLPGDVLFVAQYHGPRLPEGTTNLPKGAWLDWWRVELVFQVLPEEGD